MQKWRSLRRALWLHINPVHSLPEARKQFIRDGFGHLGDLFRAQGVSVVAAVKQNFGADADVGNVSEIDLHLVHADAAHDWSCPSFNQHLPGAGKLPGKTIVIAKGNDTNFGATLRGEGAVVTQSIAG